ncbi:MAG: MFS transporter [Ilumatobacteraceae bacterium]
MNDLTRPTADHRADLWLLLACSFGTATANSVIFAALGDLQDTYHFADSGLGLIAGAGFLTGLLVQLFIAPFADRGHSKHLIIIGLVLAGFGSVLFSTGTTLTQFIIARAVVGSSFGFVFPAVRALAANLDSDRSGERMGRVVSVELIGFVCGPLVGGILIDPIGLSATFLVFGLVAFATVAIVAPRTFPALVQTGESQKLSIELLRHPRIVVAVLVVMAIQLPIGVYDALWDRYLTDLGGTNIMVGLSFALYSVPFMLLSSTGGKIADRGEPQRIALWSMLVVSPFVFFYGFFDILWIVVGLNVFEGVAQAVAYPATVAAVAKAAPVGRASAAQGLSGSAGLVGAMLMAFTMPSVYGRYGPAVTFGFVFVLMVILTGMAAILHLKLERAEIVGKANLIS